MGTQGQRWAGFLYWSRAERGLGDLVIGSVERGDVLPQEEIDDLNCLVKLRDQLGSIREGDPEGFVLRLEPTSAETELEPTVADVIDGHRLFCQQRGMTKGVATDE